MDSKVVAWVSEFFLGRTQRFKVKEQLSYEVSVTSGLPQGSLLGPLLFLDYVSDIWKNIEWTIRLFPDDCVIYRKIINNEDIEKLQKDLDRLGEWTAENSIQINPSKCKAVRFTTALVKNPLNYTLGDQLIPEASICKYLGIILRSDLIWADHVNYTVKKAWKALPFDNAYTQKGNSSTKSLAYTTLVRPILEYGAACWDPYREGHIHALDTVQKKEAKFAYHVNESNWETLSQRRKLSRTCAVFKAYSGERAWKAIVDRLQRPNYLRRLIMNGKSGTRGKGRISGNIPLWIGPSAFRTGCVQKF